jgi:hypothetical protein
MKLRLVGPCWGTANVSLQFFELLAVWRFLPPWMRLERLLSSASYRTGNSLKVSAAADVILKPALLSSSTAAKVMQLICSHIDAELWS